MSLIEADIQGFMPHSRTMLLIAAPFGGGDEHAFASVRIAEDSLFYRPDHAGVPSWVGIEYMAQTIALHAGILAKRDHERIRIGLLLGSRKYTSAMPYYRLGAHLRISAEQDFLDDRMAVYGCRIADDDGQEISVAKLNVYQVDDADALAQGDVR